MRSIENENILTPMEKAREDVSTLNSRPEALNDFIGQSKVKENLQTFLSSAKIRGAVLDHTIFYGPPGLGKTTLANIIAKEMGSGIITTTGPILTKAGDLVAILTNMKEKDILFIDEIHRMTKTCEEILYSAMEDFRLDIIIGEGPAARSIKLNLPPFTIVGATTQLGMLSSPLQGRFGILLSLDFYELPELAEIIARFVAKTGFIISADAALSVAKISRRTPRIALRLIKRISDFATVSGTQNIQIKIVHEAARKMQIDSEGLDKTDIAYLSFIFHKCNGGPVGLETIASAISESTRSVEDVIEPFLIKEGFVIKTTRGRVLTNKSINHITSADTI